MDSIEFWVSITPGLTALVGSTLWLGRTSARLNTVERELRDLKDIRAEVATISERTKHTDDTVKQTATDLRAITVHLLDEGRSFAREIILRERDRAAPGI